jgi:hypothetical protein
MNKTNCQSQYKKHINPSRNEKKKHRKKRGTWKDRLLTGGRKFLSQRILLVKEKRSSKWCPEEKEYEEDVISKAERLISLGNFIGEILYWKSSII